jgi:hypothetical protein
MHGFTSFFSKAVNFVNTINPPNQQIKTHGDGNYDTHQPDFSKSDNTTTRLNLRELENNAMKISRPLNPTEISQLNSLP